MRWKLDPKTLFCRNLGVKSDIKTYPQPSFYLSFNLLLGIQLAGLQYVSCSPVPLSQFLKAGSPAHMVMQLVSMSRLISIDLNSKPIGLNISCWNEALVAYVVCAVCRVFLCPFLAFVMKLFTSRARPTNT
jgi:hypothetical protein